MDTNKKNHLLPIQIVQPLPFKKNHHPSPSPKISMISKINIPPPTKKKLPNLHGLERFHKKTVHVLLALYNISFV